MARCKSSRTTYVTLQDEYGRMERYLPLHEFLRLKVRPDYRRITAHLFRKTKPVEASNSQESPCELTISDAEFVIGFRGIPRETKDNKALIEYLEIRVERIQEHLSLPRLRA